MNTTTNEFAGILFRHGYRALDAWHRAGIARRGMLPNETERGHYNAARCAAHYRRLHEVKPPDEPRKIERTARRNYSAVSGDVAE